MSDTAFDLSAWLGRIGYEGSRDPTLSTLSALVLAHATTIPYENISVLVGNVPDLDLASLQRKLITDQRGGYCFEQNLLLRGGLRSFGFNVHGLLARVVRGFPADAPHNSGHMALRVELPEGTYLVDVGFGNLTPTGPVSLQPNSVQTTPHEPVRFLPVGPELLLQVKLGETWDHLYRLCTHDPLDVDYEVANWYVATRPGSIFANNMIAARAGHDGIRYTFLNGRSSVRFRDGTVERRMLDNDEAIASELASRFDLSLPASLVSTAVDTLRRKGTLAADHQFFS